MAAGNRGSGGKRSIRLAHQQATNRARALVVEANSGVIYIGVISKTLAAVALNAVRYRVPVAGATQVDFPVTGLQDQRDPVVQIPTSDEQSAPTFVGGGTLQGRVRDQQVLPKIPLELRDRRQVHQHKHFGYCSCLQSQRFRSSHMFHSCR